MISALALSVTMFAGLPLAQAQSRALQGSPDVQIALAKVDEAQALYDQARSCVRPIDRR